MLALAPHKGRGLRLPDRGKGYCSNALDSRNWDHIALRPDDVVISSAYGSDSTWMQDIVLRLVFQDQPPPVLADISPWVEDAGISAPALAKRLAAQTHRRVLKSHLALDSLPFAAGVRYIVVVHDPRDTFIAAMLQQTPVSPGNPAGGFHHILSWWAHRRLENILFVHFNDLMADPATEVGVVAEHLGLPVTPAVCEAIAAATTFSALKDAQEPWPASGFALWQNGQRTFVGAGSNSRRGKGPLTAADLQRYEVAKARALSPACAAYLEQGRRALW
jgi:aryl sulfotransferase